MPGRTRRALLACAAAMLLAPLLPAQKLTIYYTSSLKGGLDGCNCERAPVAGLVKRAAFQRTVPRDALVLDAGDVLDPYGDPDLNRDILAVYKELGYAAVAVGETDLAEGAQALAAYARRFPFLAHNLLLRSPAGDWEALSDKPLLLNRAGVSIAVLGITEPRVLEGRKEAVLGSLRLEDPAQTATRLAAESRRRGARLVIVLFHGEEEAARRLAEASPEVDLVLFGHQGWLVAPQKAGRALLASPGDYGNRIGVLSLELGPGGVESFSHRLQAFRYDRDPDDPRVRERVRAWRRKLQERLRGPAD